jgi:integrase
MPAWDTPAHRLPITVRPAAGELLGSYLTALAEANRLPVSALVGSIGRSTATAITRGQDAWLNEPAAVRLASITGHPMGGLRRALPALTRLGTITDATHGSAPALRVVSASASGPTQPACPRCTVRDTPAAALVRAAAHRPLCRRHRLWLRGWRARLEHTPELLCAQRQHGRQVRRDVGVGHVELAHAAATGIVLGWVFKDWHPRLHAVWDDRLDRLGVTQPVISQRGMLAAMIYPEVVALTGVLVQPAWIAGRGTGPAAWSRLRSAVAHRLPVELSSFDGRDPLTDWLRTPLGGDAPTQSAARPGIGWSPPDAQPPRPRSGRPDDKPRPASAALPPGEARQVPDTPRPHPHATDPVRPTTGAAAAAEAATGLLERVIADGCAVRTARAYLADWRDFAGWCAARGHRPLPATPSTVASYLTELAASRSDATVHRRRAAIAKIHQLAQFTSPTRSAVVRKTLSRLRAMPERQPVRHRAPADAAVLRRLLATLDPTADEPPAHTTRKHRQRARDRALLLIGFTGGLRRSDLVGLDVADIIATPSGLELLIGQPAGTPRRQPRRIRLDLGADPATCPVRAWQAWQQAAGLTDGPAFRPVDQWGAVRGALTNRPGGAGERLSGEAVALIVKRCAAQAGLNPAGFSGHSLRAGLVVEAARQGLALPQLAAEQRVATAMTEGYPRRGDLWTDNPATRIGL